MIAPLVAIALGFAAPAHAKPSSGLEVTQAWSRPAAAGGAGAGFMVLSNHGKTADALVAVESPAAREVQIHQSSMAGGMASMAAVARCRCRPAVGHLRAGRIPPDVRGPDDGAEGRRHPAGDPHLRQRRQGEGVVRRGFRRRAAAPTPPLSLPDKNVTSVTARAWSHGPRQTPLPRETSPMKTAWLAACRRGRPARRRCPRFAADAANAAGQPRPRPDQGPAHGAWGFDLAGRDTAVDPPARASSATPTAPTCEKLEIPADRSPTAPSTLLDDSAARPHARGDRQGRRQPGGDRRRGPGRRALPQLHGRGRGRGPGRQAAGRRPRPRSAPPRPATTSPG